jgi:hypothetical protein
MTGKLFVLASFIFCCLTGMTAENQAPVAEDKPEVFEYHGPGGLVYTVTANGLSSIKLGEQTVAAGGWYIWNSGNNWFGSKNKGLLNYPGYSKDVYKKVPLDIKEKSLIKVDSETVKVKHVQPDVMVLYTYKFKGEDVTISARVENLSYDYPIEFPTFGGLKFSFGKNPEGYMECWHSSYMKNAVKSCFHPSHLNKIGGSYAIGSDCGVGLTPFKTGLARTLFLWDYDNWGKQEDKKDRWLNYSRGQAVPAGATLTFHMQMRISRNLDWKHLLQPYKDHFRKTFGDIRYHHDDNRLVAVEHMNASTKFINEKNPYGFHGGLRRLDLEDGVKKFCEYIPSLKKFDAQGVILWGQYGSDPRGAMYRSDFDVMPPEVEENYKVLAAKLREAGLGIGVCTRPSQMAVRKDWTTDAVLDINADDPRHLEIMVWNRFKKMIDMGSNMFYLDSFGARFEHIKIMRYLREKMGPEIKTYAEHACDIMAVYSGFYCETDFWAKGSAKWCDKDQYKPRTTLEFLEKANWLLDAYVPVISRGPYDTHGEIPKDFPTISQFFYSHHMTPMVNVWRVPLLEAIPPTNAQAAKRFQEAREKSFKRMDEIKELQEKYQTPEGKWKE